MANGLNSEREAFAGESEANQDCMTFAYQPDKVESPQVARLFRVTTEAETAPAAVGREGGAVMEQPDLAGDAEKLFEQAMEAIDAEDTITALGLLERALKLRDVVGWHSWLGFCVARERGQHRRGLELCHEALEVEPDHPDHYLNLGRVHLITGDKSTAMRVMREGMTKGGSPQLARILDRLGSRKRPVFSSLSRNNPINKYLGILLSRLGIR